MQKTTALFLVILFASSIFAFNSHFINPLAPTPYLSVGGCCLLAIVVIISRYKQQKFGLSITELLSGGFFLLSIGCGAYRGSLSLEWIIAGLPLLMFYMLVKRAGLHTEWLLAGLVIIGLAQAVYGLGQYFYWFSNIAGPTFRISGSFDNPAGFAATLVVCFPFALNIVSKQGWYLKFLGVVSAVVMIAGVALAQSRAGVVALAVIIVVWLFRLLPDKWQVWFKRKTVVALLVIVAAILLGSLYFWKKDSADGRLLIWECSARMVADKPVLGYGVGGFQREYMLYQAEYFRESPDSKYMQLADIVKHPFNEYLLLWVEHGSVGVLLGGAILWLLISSYRRNSDKTEPRVFMFSLLGIAVFACFSYPLNYPFVRLMFVVSAAVIMQNESEFIHIPATVVRIIKPVALVFLLGMIAITGKMFYNEYYWNVIAQRSLAGETRKVLPEYERLCPWMWHEGLFLYNYAAELNFVGEWRKSNKLMTECCGIYNDNDVQLILADNCQQMKQYSEAEKHLKLAYEMIPNRFIPLYRLVKLYQLQGRNTDARKLAKQIMNKPVKISSFEIVEIKSEMRRILNKIKE